MFHILLTQSFRNSLWVCVLFMDASGALRDQNSFFYLNKKKLFIPCVGSMGMRYMWESGEQDSTSERQSERERDWKGGEKLEAEQRSLATHVVTTMCRLFWLCDFILIAILIGTQTHENDIICMHELKLNITPIRN